MKKIIFTNQKGGVGKTTLTRELGIALSESGRNVLLVDCDPQGNLSKSLGVEGSGLFEALGGEEVSVHPLSDSLAVLPGSFSLSLLEKRLIGEIDAYERLKDLLAGKTFSGFDYVLLDTPPSLGILTINALATADHVIIPMNPSLYSMQGTNDLMASVAKVRKGLNPELSILGVIINAFDSIPVITREIKAEIEEAFGSMVFSGHLSKSIRVEEVIAKSEGLCQQSGKEFARSKGEILGLMEELEERAGAAYVRS